MEDMVWCGACVEIQAGIPSHPKVPLNEYEFATKKLSNIQSQVCVRVRACLAACVRACMYVRMYCVYVCIAIFNMLLTHHVLAN